MLPPSLVGKTAAIAGATGSIGFAIATRFAREGASVVLAGRSVQKLQNTLKQMQDIKPWQSQTTTVQGQQKQNHAIVELDARKLSDWKALVDKHVRFPPPPTQNLQY
jgi:3-oxoacyl-[acyl-carrier protein] reductase